MLLQLRKSLQLVIMIAIAGWCTQSRATNYNPRNLDSVKVMAAIKASPTDLTIVGAHRGIHSLPDGTNSWVPENSLLAIDRAATAGIEVVELDVKLTKDGVPILSHDLTWGREWCAVGAQRGIFDPLTGNNAGSNFVVSDTLLSDTRSLFGQTWLRPNLATDACASYYFLYGEYPPTVQDVLNEMTSKGMQMVVAFDIKDAATARAVWEVVGYADDSLGRPWAKSVLFKMPGRVFPTPTDFASTFRDIRQSTFQDVNYFPFFGTGDISSTSFGSEGAVNSTIASFYHDGSVSIPAIEVNLKQRSGTLTDTLQYAKQFSYNPGIFSPFADYYYGSNPTPLFYTTTGYCCIPLVGYFYGPNQVNPNGPFSPDPSVPLPMIPNPGYISGQAVDTDDQRGDFNFVTSNAFHFVTTDRPQWYDEQLKAVGKRNISYMQNSSTASNTVAVSLTGSASSTSAGSKFVLSTVVFPSDATGSITFLDNGTVMGTEPLTYGSADYVISSIGAGNHIYTAQYSGDSNYPAASDEFVVNVSSAQPKNAGLVIEPLGDSITWGYENPPGSSGGNGYRGYLQNQLDQQGFGVNYVGSQTSGNLMDPENEGHPGYRIDQIAALTDGSLEQYVPNVVLLLAGTNDANQSYQVSSAPARLGSLIDQVVSDLPNAAVFVASLPAASDSTTEANIQAINAQIPGIVQSRASAGKNVFFVNMSAVTTSNLSDGLHPNDTGYQLMANAWDSAIQSASAKGAIQPAVPCAQTPAGCSSTAASGGHTPGPIGSAPGSAAQTFLSVVAGGVYPSPGSKVVTADLNGDGRADYIVVDRDTGALNAFINGGQNASAQNGWIWVPQGVIASGVAPAKQIQFADLNGDGKADYIIVDPATGALDVYINGGPNSSAPNGWLWIHQGIIASGVAPGSQIEMADINGDGLADYLVVNPTTGAVQAYLNGGPNSAAPNGWVWYPQGTIATGIGAPAGSQVIFADINHDGYADYLSISSLNGAVTAYLNGGKNAAAQNGWNWINLGQFSPGAGAPTTKLNISIADLNGDGKADLLAINTTSGLMQAWLDNGLDTGTPRATWQFAGSILSGVNANSVTQNTQFADINGDGLNDYAVVQNSSGELYPVYEALPGVMVAPGSYVNLGEIASGAGSGVQLADINGDGKADYLIVNPTTGAVTAYLNGGPLASAPNGWNWISVGTIASGAISSRSQVVQFADINGDGKADYLVIDMNTGSITAYLNRGQNPSSPNGWDFVPAGTIASGATVSGIGTQIFVTDLNGDGYADYVVVDGNGNAQAYLNGGANSSAPNGWIWYPQGQIKAGNIEGGTVRFADVNGDGRADYLVIDSSGNIFATYLNYGGDTNIPASRFAPNSQ